MRAKRQLQQSWPGVPPRTANPMSRKSTTTYLQGRHGWAHLVRPASRPRAARRRLALERLESRLQLAADVVVTELHFAPRDPDPGSLFATADEFEYIALKNIGTTSQQLQGWSFTDGFSFTFGNLTLAPGEQTVVVRNEAAFVERYGATGAVIAGQFVSGGLSNSGERIELSDGQGATVFSFEYDGEWYPLAAGGGHSLVVWDEAADPGVLDLIDGWRVSSTVDGSPGQDDTGVYPGAIVINEISTHTDGFPEDWLELRNTSNRSVSLIGWYMSDDSNDLTKYQVTGAVIPAGGYAVWTEAQQFGNSSDPGSNTIFGFSELGEKFFLTSPAVPNGEQYGDSISFDASANSVTFGRFIKSDGQPTFTTMQSATRGFENSGPKVGPIVISEVMYNSLAGKDFIELFNTSNQSVSLFDPAIPGNAWRFTAGINYTFPSGVSVPAGGYVLVVDDDAGAFRSANNVPAGVQIFSYEGIGGGLSNRGELLQLGRPGNPEDDGFVPYYTVDQVEYDDGTSNDPNDRFPKEADGLGPSLVRRSLFAFGDDYANWTIGVVGGSPGSADNDLIGPRVVGVRVGGSGWTRGDVMLSTGPGLQFESLPWTNVDRLTIEFNEAVTIASGALAVKGIAVSDYSLSIDVGPGVGTSQATWTFSTPIAADRLTIDLESERVLDVAGNALDGDWQDNASLFPSGNGVRGKDFRFEFRVLPGDIDRSGMVDSADLIAVLNGQFSSAGDSGYQEAADVDASGAIGLLDLVRLRRRLGTSLPVASPQPASVIVPASAERAEQAAVPKTISTIATLTRATRRRRSTGVLPPRPAARQTAGPSFEKTDPGPIQKPTRQPADRLVAQRRRLVATDVVFHNFRIEPNALSQARVTN